MSLKYSEILKNPNNIGRNMEPNTLRMFAVWCQFSQDTICHLRSNSICTNICQCCALLPRGNRCPSEQPIDKDGDSSYVFKLPCQLLVNRSINGRVSGIFENDIRKIDPKNQTFGRGQFFSVFSLGMTQCGTGLMVVRNS